MVFTQYWYWFPFGHFLSIATIPTAFIGVDKTLQMPHYECVSNAKPSLFKYADYLSDEKDKKTTEVKKAVLSTTKKAQKLLNEKNIKKMNKDAESMDADDNVPSRPQSRAAKDDNEMDATEIGRAHV